jgi:hypothetical protein
MNLGVVQVQPKCYHINKVSSLYLKPHGARSGSFGVCAQTSRLMFFSPETHNVVLLCRQPSSAKISAEPIVKDCSVLSRNNTSLFFLECEISISFCEQIDVT